MSLRVRPGEVHALLGENGAGKSTLLRTMSGVMKPNAGTIAVDGHALTLRGPLDARRAGIAMIHQELQQVRELTVAQNMFLGRSLRRGSLFVDSAAQEKAAAEALSALDPTIRPDAQIKIPQGRSAADCRDRPRATGERTHHRDGRADIQPDAQRIRTARRRDRRPRSARRLHHLRLAQDGRSLQGLQPRDRHARRAVRRRSRPQARRPRAPWSR